ncbi:MAG TPA: hypothetical protein VN605_08080, partial [Thermoanaerobaculia bacterium]|nr:hypothetical protein [Thermoanaerobaculia bacterium]
MSRTTAIALTALLLVATSAAGTNVWVNSPDDVIENPKTYSPNHRFCFVERLDSRVPDFGSVRASSLYRFDEDGHILDDQSSTEPRAGVLYEGRRPIAMLPATWDPARILVSDSGRFIVHVSFHTDNPFIIVDAADGSPSHLLHE